MTIEVFLDKALLNIDPTHQYLQKQLTFLLFIEGKIFQDPDGRKPVLMKGLWKIDILFSKIFLEKFEPCTSNFCPNYRKTPIF